MPLKMCRIDTSNYKSLLATDKNSCGNIYWYEIFCKGYLWYKFVQTILAADFYNSKRRVTFIKKYLFCNFPQQKLASNAATFRPICPYGYMQE